MSTFSDEVIGSSMVAAGTADGGWALPLGFEVLVPRLAVTVSLINDVDISLSGFGLLIIENYVLPGGRRWSPCRSCRLAVIREQ